MYNRILISAYTSKLSRASFCMQKIMNMYASSPKWKMYLTAVLQVCFTTDQKCRRICSCPTASYCTAQVLLESGSITPWYRIFHRGLFVNWKRTISISNSASFIRNDCRDSNYQTIEKFERKIANPPARSCNLLTRAAAVDSLDCCWSCVEALKSHAPLNHIWHVLKKINR